MVCAILVVADVGAAKQRQSEVWLLSPVLGICRLCTVLNIKCGRMKATVTAAALPFWRVWIDLVLFLCCS